MDLNEYIIRAKLQNNLTSDRALDRALGHKGRSVFTWKNRTSFPTDETMEKLAVMAGINPDVALQELNAWRTSGETSSRYQKIAARLAAVAAMALIFMSYSAPALAEQTAYMVTSAASSLYIMANTMLYIVISAIP